MPRIGFLFMAAVFFVFWGTGWDFLTRNFAVGKDNLLKMSLWR